VFIFKRRCEVAGKVVVFRVSDWFFERINEYCKRERISYAKLFNKAMEHLCEKYLSGEDYEKGKDSGEEDRS
jgi:hypothetical protein